MKEYPSGKESTKPAEKKKRMSNATAALATIRRSAKRVEFQIEQDRMVQDAYDRLPPVPPGELEKDGSLWRTNVDFGETENAINEKTEALVNLITQPMPYIKLSAKINEVSPELTKKLGAVGMQHYNLLKSSGFWTMEVQKMVHNMASTGLGIFHAPDPLSWHVESVPRCNLVYPPRAGFNPEKWEWMAVRRDVSILELIRMLDASSESAATAKGWDVPEIKKMIGKLKGVEEYFTEIGASVPSVENDPEGYINALQENDIGISSQCGDVLKGFTVYVKEVGGKTTQRILLEGNADSKACYIFTGTVQYDDMKDCVWLFPLSLGQGFLEKIRGLGHRILPYNALLNDMRCRSVDLTLFSSTMLLKGSKEDGLKDINQLRLGDLVTLIPPDYSLEQKGFNNPAGGLNQTYDMLRNAREANNRAFGGNGSAGQQEITATHAKLAFNQDNKGNSHETDRLYNVLTVFHGSIWKRIVAFAGSSPPVCAGSKEAKEMWEELKEIGVTADDMEKVKMVTANAMFGDGDPNQVYLALMDLMPIMGLMSASAQYDLAKRIVAARTRDPQLAEIYFPSADAKDASMTHQLWRCAVEHDAFENGSPMPLQDDDLATVHVMAHTQWAEGVVKNFEQQDITPVDAFKRLLLCREHTMEHIQILSASKQMQPIVADANTRWKNISNQMVRMQQMIQEQQAAQQQQAMEEMRNPRMSVADREKMLTEQARRAEEAATQQLRRDEIQKTEAVKRDVMTKSALTDTALKAIDSAPLLGA